MATMHEKTIKLINRVIEKIYGAGKGNVYKLSNLDLTLLSNIEVDHTVLDSPNGNVIPIDAQRIVLPESKKDGEPKKEDKQQTISQNSGARARTHRMGHVPHFGTRFCGISDMIDPYFYQTNYETPEVKTENTQLCDRNLRLRVYTYNGVNYYTDGIGLYENIKTEDGKHCGKRLIAFAKGSHIKSYIVAADTLEIAPYVFQNAENLQTICLPEGLQKIGYCAFEDSSIKHIHSYAYRFVDDSYGYKQRICDIEKDALSKSLNKVGEYAFANTEVVLPSAPLKTDYDKTSFPIKHLPIRYLKKNNAKSRN